MIHTLEALLVDAAKWGGLLLTGRFLGTCIEYELGQWAQRNQDHARRIAEWLDKRMTRLGK